MPLTLTWITALILIVDGLLFGIGFALANAVISGIAAFLSRART